MALAVAAAMIFFVVASAMMCYGTSSCFGYDMANFLLCFGYACYGRVLYIFLDTSIQILYKNPKTIVPILGLYEQPDTIQESKYYSFNPMTIRASKYYTRIQRL